ncbi:hypothetical protein HY772_09845 [Candidatus Woesearchaeota archaeon]|nr:hypothetical protein [Candidatus Woesearchaeota archaeon]
MQKKYSDNAPKSTNPQPIIAHKIISVGSDGQREVHNHATMALGDTDREIVIDVDEIVVDVNRVSAPHGAREQYAQNTLKKDSPAL